MDINELLTLKQELRFNKDGKFKILLMSDLHAGVGFSKQLSVAIEAVVNETQPDLVLINGDTSGPGRVHVETQEQLREVLALLSEPMEKRGIPWAHTFGNHDNNHGLENEEQEPVYEEFPHCVSKRGEPDIDGVGNYVLPILSSKGDKIKFNVFGLDSHNNMEQYFRETGLPERRIVMPYIANYGRDYDTVHFDQIMWYYNASKALEEYNGAAIPAMMFFHIPIPEFCMVINNRNCNDYEGNQRENIGCGELNSGLFAACLRRGDVKGIFCGHDHVNDFTGDYCGIMLGYDGGMDYNSYQHDDIRGARIFELDESEPEKLNTRMIRVRDLLGSAGDKTITE